MAETSNGGGGTSNEVAPGVSGLSMSTPEGGITMPLLTSQFYQERKRTAFCHNGPDRIAFISKCP